MMMLDSSPPVPITGSATSGMSPQGGTGGFGAAGMNVHGGSVLSNRRRTRSTRNLAHSLTMQPQNQNVNVGQIPPSESMMDTEEDGRERKRIARR